MRVSILNAGQGTDYLYGLSFSLAKAADMEIEVVDADGAVGLIDTIPHCTLFNLRGDNTSPQAIPAKMFRIIRYYVRLLFYAAKTKSVLFHIQWDNSFFLFDRTVLLLYYKLLGKKLVFTAHNVDRKERDERSDAVNRFSLNILYRLVDCIIVHTQRMKDQLVSGFSVNPEKIIVIPHGVNIRMPRTGITKEAARKDLHLPAGAHIVLFFGMIDRYKGVDLAIEAVAQLAKDDAQIFFLIAGAPKDGSAYLSSLKNQAAQTLPAQHYRFDAYHIPPEEVERYCAASDCAVLPYKKIYQSGVLFLAYRFGIPVIATDVGNFREDVLDGKTGYVCEPGNSHAMAETLRMFFNGALFTDAAAARTFIIAHAEKNYSWDVHAAKTIAGYKKILGVL